jgi:hypothetical protein
MIFPPASLMFLGGCFILALIGFFLEALGEADTITNVILPDNSIYTR